MRTLLTVAWRYRFSDRLVTASCFSTFVSFSGFQFRLSLYCLCDSTYLMALQVVHNYGHGSEGFITSWGCASDVADMIEPLLPVSKLWACLENKSHHSFCWAAPIRPWAYSSRPKQIFRRWVVENSELFPLINLLIVIVCIHRCVLVIFLLDETRLSGSSLIVRIRIDENRSSPLKFCTHGGVSIWTKK